MFKMSFKRHFKQIIASEEINKSKGAGQWESQPMIRVGKLTIWIRSFEIIIEFTKSISPIRIRKPVLMMDVKAFIKKHSRISSEASIILESTIVHKYEEGEQ